jgi:hypothetical protein
MVAGGVRGVRVQYFRGLQPVFRKNKEEEKGKVGAGSKPALFSVAVTVFRLRFEWYLLSLGGLKTGR